MKCTTIILLVLCWGSCLSQTDYYEILSRRLNEIEKLKYYDNSVVIYIDSVERNDLSFPYWNPNDMYYQDEMVRYKYSQYVVLTDSTIGQSPDTSQNDWRLVSGPHPYLFLRDTTRLEDLKNLMMHENSYIRCYAFAALSFRKCDNLFPIIVDNLDDSNQMLVFTGDVGMNAYPADLMLEYEGYRLSKSEKKKIKKLIRTRYKYLSRGLAAL